MGWVMSKNSKPKEEPKQASPAKSESKTSEAAEYCETAFEKLQGDESCKSLLKKHLTKEIVDDLKSKTTSSFDSTLKDVIQSGVENLDSGVGVYAPDADAYDTFSDLFYPIIAEYHNFDPRKESQPKSDFGNPEDFGDLDPDCNFIVSTRIRCGRSIEGLPFNPNMKEKDYEKLESLAQNAFKGIADEDFQGAYHPLKGMDDKVQKSLLDQHFLFKEGDRFLKAAQALNFWPVGRGIFLNDAKTFLTWVGEEDHLRIISMERGGNVGNVYGRLVKGIQQIKEAGKMDYSHNEKLGFLTFCPTNLGTTIRASVHIKLPRLAEKGHEALQGVADEFQLQVRGSSGEHSEAVGGLYDISNRERMGLNEYQAVKKMYDGVAQLIKMEKQLIESEAKMDEVEEKFESREMNDLEAELEPKMDDGELEQKMEEEEEI